MVRVVVMVMLSVPNQGDSWSGEATAGDVADSLEALLGSTGMVGEEEGEEEEEDDPDLKDEPILKVDLHVSKSFGVH